MLLGWLWSIFANIAVGASFETIATVIGRGFDTVLMYFVARLTLIAVDDAKELLIPLALTALFMCAMGILEASMLYSPYQSLRDFRMWKGFGEGKGVELRLGFARAQTSTSVSIYFGMAMVVIAGILWSIRGYARNLIFIKGSTFAAFFGALTSLSSGPWLGCATLVFFNAFVKRTNMIKPTLILLFTAALLLEVASNRHFYHLIDYLALSKATAWYRTRLLEVAFSQWQEFWLFGLGGKMPHHWADMIDGRGHIDVVNHFIIIALAGGILGLLLYIGSHIMAIRAAIHSWRLQRDNQVRNMIFGFTATLIALDFTSMSVGLFGPVLLLSYILLGFLVSASVNIR